jgi:plasmid stabilization system protein ParE
VTKVVVSPQAEADLLKIANRIADAAGFVTAEKYVDQIVSIVTKLAMIPHAAGHPVPQLGVGLRCHAIGYYNTYLRYDEKADTLYLVRVLHARRRIGKKTFR